MRIDVSNVKGIRPTRLIRFKVETCPNLCLNLSTILQIGDFQSPSQIGQLSAAENRGWLRQTIISKQQTTETHIYIYIYIYICIYIYIYM